MDTAILQAPAARSLDRLAEHAQAVAGVRIGAVRAGDWVVVKTKNSTYSLLAGDNGTFRVAGGWFAANDAESAAVRILGCTWGGHALHTGLLAAPGMFLEFSNGVRTTRIREVRLIRAADTQPH